MRWLLVLLLSVVGCGEVDSDSQCGDGICSLDESVTNCVADCTQCGDSICDATETVDVCAEDCGACGDGVCDTNESRTDCPRDCAICGDGRCDASETASNCSSDCNGGCAANKRPCAGGCIPEETTCCGSAGGQVYYCDVGVCQSNAAQGYACVCPSGTHECDGSCISDANDCCESGTGLFCANRDCRATTADPSGFACWDWPPEPLFEDFGTANLFVGAYWEYKWHSTVKKNGQVISHDTGVYRLDLTGSRTASRPQWGDPFTLYRLEKTEVSSTSEYANNTTDGYKWIGVVGQRVVGGIDNGNDVALYVLYDGYTGVVACGGIMGRPTVGACSESVAMRWVQGSTSYFNGTFIEAAAGTSSGGCTSVGGIQVCTPASGSSDREYIHPAYLFIGSKSSNSNTYPEGVYSGVQEWGLVDTNIGDW